MNNETSIKRFSNPLTGILLRMFALTLFVGIAGCEDLEVKPGSGTYPIQLSGQFQETHVFLQWDKTPVSSFEEYIILRSSEPIADNPEPQTDAVTSVIARIDEIDKTVFEDASFLLDGRIYYKVYADIGARFLYSPTVEVEPDFTSIPLRVDASFIDTKNHRFIAFDQSTDIVFEYDYVNDEMIRSATVALGLPIVRAGTYLGNEEVYLYDNSGILHIHDRNTLAKKTTISPNFFTVSDFIYHDGKFIVSYRGGNPGLAVLSRNGQLLSSSNEVSAVDHKLLIQEGAETIIFDIGLQKMTKFRLASDGKLSVLDTEMIQNPGSLSIPHFNHAGTHFVTGNSGRIFDTDFNYTGIIKSGGKIFTDFSFSADDQFLAGTLIEFIGNMARNRVIFYDLETYEPVREINIPFQCKVIFADGEDMYCMGVVFINSTSSTILLKINTAG